MKSFTILAALFAGLTFAQLPPISSLPQCGQTCIGNMQNQASALGCSSSTDVACLCGNQNFRNGVRDCANQACGNAGDANSTISFGTSYCAGKH